MLAAFAASGQTTSAFARANGFSPHRVVYWRTKLAERQGLDVSPSNSGFVHVAVRDDARACQGGTERRVEVTLLNGRVAVFAGTWEAAAITPWLHALEGER